MRGHGRCRGLPVASRHGNTPFIFHEQGQYLRPLHQGHAPARGFPHLGVILFNRRRVHHDARFSDIAGLVPDLDARAEVPEFPRDSALPGVRTAHLVSVAHEQAGDPAHADAADTDKMKMFGQTVSGNVHPHPTNTGTRALQLPRRALPPRRNAGCAGTRHAGAQASSRPREYP